MMTTNVFNSLLATAAVTFVFVLLLKREESTLTSSSSNVRGSAINTGPTMELMEIHKMHSLNETRNKKTFKQEYPNDGVEHWPKLESLIGDMEKNVKQDVQFMLDFAIIGHPKTATTFTMEWLASHEEIQMQTHELHALQTDKPAELVSIMYQFPPGRHFKRGYKAPRDIVNHHALQAFAQYWPDTKLIVGLRHPVRWFESFYNFRVRHNFEMPPAESLIGPLRSHDYGVCTDEALFHHHLDNLGKTNRTDPLEMQLLASRKRPSGLPRQMKNPIFLYEIGQLYDSNQTRTDQYLSDLKEFLGLEKDLESIKSHSSSKAKESAIDICDDKFIPLRTELMKHAVGASTWIRAFFLDAPGVTVSSRYHFEDLLKEWLVDPCLAIGKGN